MPSAPRHRRFAMTYNNYTPAGVVILQTQAQQLFDKYFIAGKEVGEDGTPHLQMYGECTNKYDVVGIKSRLTALCRDFTRIHIEVAGGNGPQNFQYCSKDGDFFELGTRPSGRGKRTDLDDACAAIKSGATIQEVALEYSGTYVKYTNGLNRLLAICAPKRNFMTIGYWLHGATGTGKSRWVHQNFPQAYWKPCLGQWFDGYSMEDTVVIDDYRVDAKDHTSLRWLLRLVDRYPLQVPIKGAFVPFVAKRVIITSPHSLEDSFKNYSEVFSEDVQQLIRRFPHRLLFDHSVTISNYLQIEGINPEIPVENVPVPRRRNHSIESVTSDDNSTSTVPSIVRPQEINVDRPRRVSSSTGFDRNVRARRESSESSSEETPDLSHFGDEFIFDSSDVEEDDPFRRSYVQLGVSNTGIAPTPAQVRAWLDDVPYTGENQFDC